MLFGKEMRNGFWKVTEECGKQYLMFERDRFMYKKIPCGKMLSELYKRVADDYKNYFFYVFASNDGNPEFVFMSKCEISFKYLAHGNLQCEENVAIVDGALFNLHRQHFVHFGVGGRQNIFFEFVLYDSDVPHVVYDPCDYSYVIYHNGGFEKTQPCVDLEFFSHAKYNTRSMTCEITRAISYEAANGIKKFIIIKNGINVVRIIENVEIKDVINIGGYEKSAMEYIKVVHKNDDLEFFDQEQAIMCVIPSWHMYGNDVIILRDMTYSSDMGNFFMVSFNKVNVTVGMDHMFFAYELVENPKDQYSLRLLAKRNDFENAEMIVNLS